MRHSMALVVLLCIASVGGNDPFDDEYEMAAWGVHGVVWEEHVQGLPNLTVVDSNTPAVVLSYNISEDVAWSAMHNESVELISIESEGWEGLSENESLSLNSTAESTNSLVNFSFTQEEHALFDKLGSLFDTLFSTMPNHTATVWEFVVLVTLAPVRCSDVDKVAVLFDAAMRESNPGSNITSVAQRLGGAVCGTVCPCKEARRYSQRVMELRSTSRQRVLQPPPAHFPYFVQIEAS
jgi:hypothetical protein